MINFEKMFFPYINYDGKYVAVLQMSKLPSMLTPTSYIEKIVKSDCIPFIIYKDYNMNFEDLEHLSKNLMVTSNLTCVPIDELENMTTNKIMDLINNSVHKAVYGMILEANNKDLLFEKYKDLKDNLKDDNICINHTYFNKINCIKRLKEEKVIYNENFRKNNFIFFNVPKSVTDLLIKEINYCK